MSGFGGGGWQCLLWIVTFSDVWFIPCQKNYQVFPLHEHGVGDYNCFWYQGIFLLNLRLQQACAKLVQVIKVITDLEIFQKNSFLLKRRLFCCYSQNSTRSTFYPSSHKYHKCHLELEWFRKGKVASPECWSPSGHSRFQNLGLPTFPEK